MRANDRGASGLLSLVTSNRTWEKDVNTHWGGSGCRNRFFAERIFRHCNWLPREVVTAAKMLCLDNSQRCLVWFLCDPEWSQELDLIFLVGLFLSSAYSLILWSQLHHGMQSSVGCQRIPMQKDVSCSFLLPSVLPLMSLDAGSRSAFDSHPPNAVLGWHWCTCWTASTIWTVCGCFLQTPSAWLGPCPLCPLQPWQDTHCPTPPCLGSCVSLMSACFIRAARKFCTMSCFPLNKASMKFLESWSWILLACMFSSLCQIKATSKLQTKQSSQFSPSPSLGTLTPPCSVQDLPTVSSESITAFVYHRITAWFGFKRASRIICFQLPFHCQSYFLLASNLHSTYTYIYFCIVLIFLHQPVGQATKVATSLN